MLDYIVCCRGLFLAVMMGAMPSMAYAMSIECADNPSSLTAQLPVCTGLR